jgi:hypothetical protein
MSIVRVLRNRFIFAPVKLSTSIRPFCGLEHAISLYQLAREYLPEDYQEFTDMTPDAAADKFISKFEKNYFPLGYVSSYDRISSLVKNIPVSLNGLNRNNYDYHWHDDPARLLAGALLECPFENMDNLALLDMFIQSVVKAAKDKTGDTENMLREHLKWSYSMDEIEAALAGINKFPYPAILLYCRWYYSRTGNYWLDHTGSRAWYRETVEALARDWKPYKEMEVQMARLKKWLGEDLPGRSMEIINYLESRLPRKLVQVFAEGENNGQSN